jgi:RsiW-degrading membrane proteinase PrsW (M82 family)
VQIAQTGRSLTVAALLIFAAADVQVSAGNEFRERNLHVLTNTLNLLYSLGSGFFEEGCKRFLL